MLTLWLLGVCVCVCEHCNWACSHVDICGCVGFIFRCVLCIKVVVARYIRVYISVFVC